MNKKIIVILLTILLVILGLVLIGNYFNKSALGPGQYDFSLKHNGLTRAYRIYVPPAYDYKKITPMVIFLHGGGGNLERSKIDGMYEKSDKLGFILASPAGTGLLRNRLLTWNGGQYEGKGKTDACCGYAVEHNIDDVGFISQMIDQVKKNFNIDDKRVYAAGISNGGLMTYRLACELSDKIAAVAPVAPPGVPLNCQPQRPVSIMQIHGTADPCAPYEGGEGGACIGSTKYEIQSARKVIDTWIGINGCSLKKEIAYKKGSAICESYNECKYGSAVELCTITGGGHVWPSGDQYLSVQKIGSVFYDISFDQMWEFFLKHPME